MNPEEEKPKKRKRGRPPKKKAELPTFKNERDIRKYLLDTSLELALELKENAVKKNNIKKPNVANAKNQQYKTALTSLKVANEILKDIQIDKFEEATKLYEEKGFSNAYTIELGLRLDKANECLIKTLEEKSEVANFLTNEIIKNLLNNQMELILFSNCILNILIASYEKEPSENLLGTVKAVHEVINLELIFLKSLLERSFLYDLEDYSEKVAIIEEAYSTYEKLASKIESL